MPLADFIQLAGELLSDSETLIAQHLNEIEAAEVGAGRGVLLFAQGGLKAWLWYVSSSPQNSIAIHLAQPATRLCHARSSALSCRPGSVTAISKAALVASRPSTRKAACRGYLPACTKKECILAQLCTFATARDAFECESICACVHSMFV